MKKQLVRLIIFLDSKLNLSQDLEWEKDKRYRANYIHTITGVDVSDCLSYSEIIKLHSAIERLVNKLNV